MTTLKIGALAAINVGVINEKGAIETTITLEEFLRVAQSQHIYFHSNAPSGELDFDLTVSRSDDLIAKVNEWRKQQSKKIVVTGIIPVVAKIRRRSALRKRCSRTLFHRVRYFRQNSVVLSSGPESVGRNFDMELDGQT